MDGGDQGWSPIEGGHPPPPAGAQPPPPPLLGAPGPVAPPPGWAPQPKAGDARTGPLPLHPMGVGDILDGAFKIFKANAKTVVVVVLAVLGPLQVATAFLTRSAFQRPSIFEMFEDPSVAEAAAENGSADWALVLGGLIGAVGQSAGIALIGGGLTTVVLGAYVGRPVEAGRALRIMVRRSPALLVAFVAVHILELIGFVLCVLPAAAVMALFVLTSPAVVAEELGPFAGMRRSFELVRRRFWPVLGTALLAGLIAWMLSQMFGLVPGLLLGLFSPDWAWIPAAAVTVLVSLVTEPVVALVAVLLYVDARIRHEAFDLQVRAAGLTGAVPGR